MLSRVADNLYWMSRYLERAQHTARLLDTALGFMLDQSPLLVEQRWARILRSLHISNKSSEVLHAFNPYALTHELAFDATNEVSIFSCVRWARENARQVREEISEEMWECLNRLYLRVRAARPPLDTRSSTSPMAQTVVGISQSMSSAGMLQSMDATAQSTHAFWRQPQAFFSDVQRSAFEFEGATDATMRHGEGWLFIQVGRGLEQAAKTVSLLKTYFDEDAQDKKGAISEGNLKWTALLKSCAAFEPYCRVHSPRLVEERIAEFLLLDAEFPRSVRAAVGRVENSLHAITEITGNDAPVSTSDENAPLKLLRLAGRLKAMLDCATVAELMNGDMAEFLRETQEDCVRIHNAIYHAYIGYMAE